MDPLNTIPTCLSTPAAAFIAGIILHVGVFRYSEWDTAANRLILCFFFGYVFLLYGFIYHWASEYASPLGGFIEASRLMFSILGGIYSSMLVYRVFFHRLCSFPGPLLARVSSLYAVGLSMRRFHMFKEAQLLHKTYGDFVRLGPSEISIANPEASEALHSNTSPCLKGPWYNIFEPTISLHATRNKQEHANRRKVWDRAFGAKALRDYEPRVTRYTDLLMNQIEKNVGKPLDITLWMDFFGFDVMGDLAFGRSFGMLIDGVKHSYMELAQKSTLWGTQFGRSSWAYLIMKKVPIINNQIERFLKWLRNYVNERKEKEPERPDVFSWILSSYQALLNPSKQDELNLLGDAHLIVVAGSDTTSASLTCAFFELARNPLVYKELQRELDEYLSTNKRPEYVSLAKLGCLQAVIDEVMRLYPAIPSGTQRVTPPQGLHVGKTFIPGNTIVQIPTYTLNRDERCFAQPDEFIPERWTTRPELVRNNSAFAPFSIGRYSCAGKQLALMEMRHVITRVVTEYDICFAPGQIADVFLDGLADGFTLVCPKLDLIFKHRKA